MIFSLDIRRARKGDCLLLHYGTATNPGLIVIDGGPSSVYKDHLKPRLKKIHAARELEPDDPLPVDMLMISHVDDDHIKGILDMTKELVEAKQAARPLSVRVRSLWHNTFDDVLGKSPKELREAVTATYGAASLDGEPGIMEGLDFYDAKVLASVAQGIRLRDDAKILKWPVNKQFDGKLVMATKPAKKISMGKNLSLVIAGPAQAELKKLQAEHDKFLEKKAKKGAEASLAAFTDTSIANLSSLVVIAKAGGKSMLLTGDARGDKILEGLKLIGALKNGKLHVDILKMPHHGSDRNMEQSFLEKVTADHYVFSGNGEHGNPERETLEMLRLARDEDDEYTIHLTYPIDETDTGREEDWDKERAKEQARKKKKPKAKVRSKWSHKKHSLEAFFDDHPDMADRLEVADKNRHVIDLLDELEY